LPYPQYAYVADENEGQGFSEYNSGHFALQKRYGNGLSFLTDYTFSKELSSGFYQATQTNTRKMLSPIDIPWVVTLSYAYDLPFGRGKLFLNRDNLADRLV